MLCGFSLKIEFDYKQTGTFRVLAVDKDYLWGDYVRIRENKVL